MKILIYQYFMYLFYIRLLHYDIFKNKLLNSFYPIDKTNMKITKGNSFNLF